jgi:hypothetical protein
VVIKLYLSLQSIYEKLSGEHRQKNQNELLTLVRVLTSEANLLKQIGSSQAEIMNFLENLKGMKTLKHMSIIIISIINRNGDSIFCSTGRNNDDTGDGFLMR